MISQPMWSYPNQNVDDGTQTIAMIFKSMWWYPNWWYNIQHNVIISKAILIDCMESQLILNVVSSKNTKPCRLRWLHALKLTLLSTTITYRLDSDQFSEFLSGEIPHPRYTPGWAPRDVSYLFRFSAPDGILEGREVSTPWIRAFMIDAAAFRFISFVYALRETVQSDLSRLSESRRGSAWSTVYAATSSLLNELNKLTHRQHDRTIAAEERQKHKKDIRAKRQTHKGNTREKYKTDDILRRCRRSWRVPPIDLSCSGSV